jgi:lipoate-protein ligase A
LDQEVDWEYCHSQGIPVYRRSARARITCCAPVQLELQLVLSREHRLLTQTSHGKLRPVLSPLFDTCRDLHVQVAFKSPNELVVGGRRIASACLSEVNDRVVLAASLTLEFDAELFARVLNVPDPVLRGRLAELARAHRTSLREQLGALPPGQQLERRVRGHLQLIAGGLRPGTMDEDLRAQIGAGVGNVFAPARRQGSEAANGWKVDLGGGAELQQCAYKAPGGFLRAACEWQDGRIVHASLGGEFFCYPPGGLFQLEAALVGVRADQVAAKIDEFYRELGLVTPGIHAAHWAKVLAPTLKAEG